MKAIILYSIQNLNVLNTLITIICNNYNGNIKVHIFLTIPKEEIRLLNNILNLWNKNYQNTFTCRHIQDVFKEYFYFTDIYVFTNKLLNYYEEIGHIKNKIKSFKMAGPNVMIIVISDIHGDIIMHLDDFFFLNLFSLTTSGTDLIIYI